MNRIEVKRRKPLSARVGILPVGHHLYWPQFDGLLDEMHRKTAAFAEQVKQCGVTTLCFDISDNAQSAYRLIQEVKKADLDLLFVHMATYATSASIGVFFKELQIPIVLVALQPLAAMDYPNGTTFMQLCNDDICSVPEFTGVAIRMGRRSPPVIIGLEKDDPGAEREIRDWCSIANALHDLKQSRIGLMGHVLESMLDMHTDPTAVTAAFGCHVVLTEPHELISHYSDAPAARIEEKKQQILSFFDTPEPVSDPLTTRLTDEDLLRAAQAAVALDLLIEEKQLDGLAYYYEGKEGSLTREVMSSLIAGNSLLTGAGFPMCGEFDLKTCLAMMIMDRLDIGGSFAEFHPIDFTADTVLVGHDGPHHINISSGKPVIRSLKKYHGKPGRGASVEFSLKEGPITMLSIGQTGDGRFTFVIAEGESINNPIPPTGNTNTHVKFCPDVRTFLKRWFAEGPTHHFALGLGHKAGLIKQVADCLGIESVIIDPS